LPETPTSSVWTGCSRRGLLEPADLEDAPSNEGRIDYGAVIPFKEAALRRAFETFQKEATSEQEA
jgi:4-alpha-glucanotransferase